MQIVSDLKIASILMFIGSILFLIGVLLSLPQSREDRAFEAKTVQVTMDLIHSIFVYVGSTGFLYLSFTDNGWGKLLMNLNSYNLKNEPFYKRYFTGNILLISVWLFFFPSLLDVLFPIWGFHDYANSGISAGPYNSDINYVQLLASLVVVVFINFFWVYATLPGNMRINGGAGPREFLYYISVIGLIYLKCIRPCFGYSDRLSEDGSEQPLMEQAKFNSEFSQHRNTTISIPNISSSEPVQNWLFRVFGSDYTIGVLIFSLSSTAGLIISGIMAFDNSTDPEYIYGVICSLIFTLGTYFLLYGSHPLRMYQHDGSGSHDFFLLLQKMCGSTAVKVDGI